MTKNKILLAFTLTSLVAYSNSGSSGNDKVVIPDSVKLQADSTTPISDHDFDSAKDALMKLNDDGVDFDLDHYLFCKSSNPNGLAANQQKLLSDIKANCNLKQVEPKSDDPIQAGAVKKVDRDVSITAKGSNAVCPVTESVKTNGSFKIITLDQSTRSLTGRGQVHADSQRTAVSPDAKKLLGLELMQLSADAQLSMTIENDGPLSKYTELTSSGFIQPVSKSVMALNLKAQVLQPASGKNQMSLAFSLRDPGASQNLSVALVAHWSGSQIPTIDQMTLGGRKVSDTDLVKMQQTSVLRNLMKSMSMNDDCPAN